MEHRRRPGPTHRHINLYMDAIHDSLSSTGHGTKHIYNPRYPLCGIYILPLTLWRAELSESTWTGIILLLCCIPPVRTYPPWTENFGSNWFPWICGWWCWWRWLSILIASRNNNKARRPEKRISIPPLSLIIARLGRSSPCLAHMWITYPHPFGAYRGDTNGRSFVVKCMRRTTTIIIKRGRVGGQPPRTAIPICEKNVRVPLQRVCARRVSGGGRGRVCPYSSFTASCGWWLTSGSHFVNPLQACPH